MLLPIFFVCMGVKLLSSCLLGMSSGTDIVLTKFILCPSEAYRPKEAASHIQMGRWRLYAGGNCRA